MIGKEVVQIEGKVAIRQGKEPPQYKNHNHTGQGVEKSLDELKRLQSPLGRYRRRFECFPSTGDRQHKKGETGYAQDCKQAHLDLSKDRFFDLANLGAIQGGNTHTVVGDQLNDVPRMVG